jgi:hypothetical protein
MIFASRQSVCSLRYCKPRQSPIAALADTGAHQSRSHRSVNHHRSSCRPLTDWALDSSSASVSVTVTCSCSTFRFETQVLTASTKTYRGNSVLISRGAPRSHQSNIRVGANLFNLSRQQIDFNNVDLDHIHVSNQASNRAQHTHRYRVRNRRVDEILHQRNASEQRAQQRAVQLPRPLDQPADRRRDAGAQYEEGETDRVRRRLPGEALLHAEERQHLTRVRVSGTLARARCLPNTTTSFWSLYRRPSLKTQC